MKSDTLFTDVEPITFPPRRRRVGATTDSIALVACNGHYGTVICHDGPGIESAIEDTSPALDACGLDDAPDGLSIWEGCYITTRDYWGEYDAYLSGHFRDLTEAEWTLLRETDVPWEMEEILEVTDAGR